ncbi:MAG: DegT/DnrJ/EryC1/StrS family aminotransferase [Candidatus Methanomethyliaceae archaeon]|nr:DegT/DnrJ/EryC1/StrS family aminotransferase [Candidatus Methanomethyliaceae archaeon]
MIPINKPILGNEEKEAVLKVLESGALTNASAEGGFFVKTFEKDLASFMGAKDAVVVNSGTAALQVSLLAMNIKPGDEVIVPSFTFAATAGAVLLVGAKPVFVDIDLNTYNMDPEAFRRAITSRTKAVIPVDLYGLPAKIDEIREYAERYGIAIIEDACQAQGASYNGRMAGTLGDVGCLSFYPGKVMTTGEGGAIITNDQELADKLRMIRTHGQTKGYDSKLLGGNFRMPEIEAAIGIVQLRKLSKFLEARAKNARILIEKLNEADLILPQVPENTIHNWYLFTVRFANEKIREIIRNRLLKEGIGATVYYPTPVHKLPYYISLGYGKIELPNTEMASKTVLSLPVNPLIEEKDLEKTSKIIFEVLSSIS